MLEFTVAVSSSVNRIKECGFTVLPCKEKVENVKNFNMLLSHFKVLGILNF